LKLSPLHSEGCANGDGGLPSRSAFRDIRLRE
jgi:hypothetical protein